MPAAFREFIPPPGHPKRAGLHLDPVAYADHYSASERFKATRQWWSDLFAKPYRGVSADGAVLGGLFSVQPEGAPTAEMSQAATALLAALGPDERQAITRPMGASEWRQWSNPGIYIARHGLRLEDMSADIREAVFGLMRASLSPYGYQKARDCMFMNGFLGHLLGGGRALNEFAYNITLFGEISDSTPWGWQIHGHHLVINCMTLAGQMVVTPCFWGAEPNEVDEGPRQGLKMFVDEERLGLALLESLDAGLMRQAIVFDKAGIPPERIIPGDRLHLTGAFQDNRVIPYEGLAAADMPADAQRRLLDLVEVYHRHLPDAVRHARMTDIERRLDETRFGWIGDHGPDDPFYYRIQSPVTVIEFDHHAGIYLTNEEPKKFHIHTLMRTPNGNDYGMAVVKQWCELSHLPAQDLVLK